MVDFFRQPAVQQGFTIAGRAASFGGAIADVVSGGATASTVAGLTTSSLNAVALVPGVPSGTLESIATGIGTARSVVQGVGKVFPSLKAAFEGAVASHTPLPEVTFQFETVGDWRVMKLRAQEAMSETWEATIDLAGDDLHDDPDVLLGGAATLTLTRGACARHFRGVVRRVEHLGTADGRLLARAYLVPSLWSLSQRINSRIFHAVKVIDVVRAVLRDAGLYDGHLDVALRDTYLEREYCVQYRESDLAFIQRLLEEEGITYFFRHDADHETLVITDHDCYQPITTLDGQAVPVAGTEASVLSSESVRQLDWGREQRPTAVIVRDFDFTRPQVPVTQQVPRDAGARPVYEYPAEAVFSDYRQGSEQHHDDNIERLAQIRLQALRASEQQGVGPSNVTGLTPGHAFTLRAHGRAALNQRYVITRVVHVGNAPEVLTHETQHSGGTTDRYRNELTCIPASVPWRPPRVTPRPLVTGIQTATVVGPAGREIYTDAHGRIKVRFHWDRHDESRDPDTLRWVRVAQAWGGGTWGAVVTPRIGMEVVVQFIEGNPDRPLVMGCVYNNRNRPAVEHPYSSSQTRLRSNSTPGGNGFNELSFEDAAGSELFYMHAQRDQQVDVLHDQRVTVDNDRTMTVKGEETQSIIKGRTTRIGGGEHNEVSPDSLTITGNMEVHVQGQEALQDASHVWHIKANDRVLIECPPSSIDMTRGRIVITTGASTIELSGGTINIHSRDLIDIKSKLVKINS